MRTQNPDLGEIPDRQERVVPQTPSRRTEYATTWIPVERPPQSSCEPTSGVRTLRADTSNISVPARKSSVTRLPRFGLNNETSVDCTQAAQSFLNDPPGVGVVQKIIMGGNYV